MHNHHHEHWLEGGEVLLGEDYHCRAEFSPECTGPKGTDQGHCPMPPNSLILLEASEKGKGRVHQNFLP